MRFVNSSPQRGRHKASPALQRRETEQLVNKAPDGGDAESRHFPRHAPYGWGIGLRNEGRGVFVGGHFTFGEASPPLGAFDEISHWFPALKRRAGLTSPPLGAFANDDQGDR